jgi:hypothetical protein
VTYGWADVYAISVTFLWSVETSNRFRLSMHPNFPYQLFLCQQLSCTGIAILSSSPLLYIGSFVNAILGRHVRLTAGFKTKIVDTRSYQCRCQPTSPMQALQSTLSSIRESTKIVGLIRMHCEKSEKMKVFSCARRNVKSRYFQSLTGPIQSRQHGLYLIFDRIFICVDHIWCDFM